MKKFTLKIKSILHNNILLLILLGFGFIELHAQNSPTDIIPVGSTVTKLSSNQFHWAEGPVWYNDSVLLFDDNGVSGSNIYQYNPITKQISKWPTNSVDCNGLTCDKDGNLIGCSSSIIMMNKTGQIIKTLASGYNGKAFNNPNDLIADDKGGVYFTDPAYFVQNPPQDKKAVYYIDSTGNVKRIIDEFEKPNGIILSPNGKKLYLEVPDSTYVYSWDVASDGSVSGRSQFALLHTLGGLNSESDGIAIDVNGNIYVADDMGIEVFSNNGEFITTILVPEKPSNCDFGGKDFKTLYITAITNLYSIDLNFPGYAVSRKILTGTKNSIPGKPLVEIYPNPARNLFNIKESSNLPGSEFDIIDLSGRKVLKGLLNSNTTQVDISHLSPGEYFFQIVGQKQQSIKVIKN